MDFILRKTKSLSSLISKKNPNLSPPSPPSQIPPIPLLPNSPPPTAPKTLSYNMPHPHFRIIPPNTPLPPSKMIESDNERLRAIIKLDKIVDTMLSNEIIKANPRRSEKANT